MAEEPILSPTEQLENIVTPADHSLLALFLSQVWIRLALLAITVGSLVTTIIVLVVSSRTTAPKQSHDTLLNPIYYYPAHEGFTAQLRHLEFVWNIARTVNRSVIAIPFHSSHYANVTVDLCKVFDHLSTQGVGCDVNEKVMTALIHHDECAVMGKDNTVCRQPHVFNHRNCTSQFDWKDIKCVAGTPGWIDQKPNGNIDYHYYGISPPILDYHKLFWPGEHIRYHYRSLFTRMIKEFGWFDRKYENQEVIVIHWRRGDQNQRCTGKIRGQVFPLSPCLSLHTLIFILSCVIYLSLTHTSPCLSLHTTLVLFVSHTHKHSIYIHHCFDSMIVVSIVPMQLYYMIESLLMYLSYRKRTKQRINTLFDTSPRMKITVLYCNNYNDWGMCCSLIPHFVTM